MGQFGTSNNSAVLWQKEASDKSPKSEKVKFFIGLSMFYFQSEFWAETLIMLKDISVKSSWYCIDVTVHDRNILLIYEKFNFPELLPFVRVGQHLPWLLSLYCISSVQSNQKRLCMCIFFSWEPEGHYNYSLMFFWESKGQYHCTKSDGDSTLLLLNRT